jgi:hypothetical protein
LTFTFATTLHNKIIISVTQSTCEVGKPVCWRAECALPHVLLCNKEAILCNVKAVFFQYLQNQQKCMSVLYDSLSLPTKQTRHMITSIGKMQSNTNFNICIAKRFFYRTCLNNDMFRPLYRPSSGCTISYYRANYTIYSVFVFVNEISCTSIECALQ